MTVSPHLALQATAPVDESAFAVDGHTHETACLNCHTRLIGGYCHACGQAAHVHRTLGAFFHDLLHGVFHFEGRIWRTLPLLVWQPGHLTRRYINGERTRFVSPLALFLFTVFLLFTAIQETGGVQVTPSPAKIATRGDAGLASAERDLASLRQQRAAAHGDAADDLDDAIEAAADKVAEARVAQAVKSDGKLPSTGLSFLDNGIANLRANPALTIYKIQMHAYKFSWLLIPISLPFMALLYPFKRRFPLYDHTVFVTYSLCFMTLITVLSIVGDALGATWLGGLYLLAPWHMYRQLRGTYGGSRGGTLLRTCALVSFAFIALTIFVAAITAEIAT